jgi:hypothetical protein
VNAQGRLAALRDTSDNSDQGKIGDNHGIAVRLRDLLQRFFDLSADRGVRTAADQMATADVAQDDTRRFHPGTVQGAGDIP